MKTKRRCQKVNFDLTDYLKQYFEKNYTSLMHLSSILAAAEGIEQINLLKEVEAYLLNNDVIEDELLLSVDVLFVMFYQAPYKSSHKKALTRTIQELSKKHPLVIEKCLQNSIKSFADVSTLHLPIEEMEKSALHIICIIDNLTLGKKVVDQNSNYIWKYAILILKTVIDYLKQESSLQKKNDYYNVCQNILKFIIHVIQNCDSTKCNLKCNKDEKIQASSEEIMICFQYLLTNENTKLNCRLNAAFAFCYYCYYSFGNEELYDMVSESSSKFSLSSRLCIYSSIMAVLPMEEFVKSVNDHSVANEIVYGTLKISKNSDSSEILLLCARNILQWTSVIKNLLNKNTGVDKNVIETVSHMLSEDKNVMKLLFEYVLHNRDHFIDSLRHLSKDIFRNLLSLHILSSEIEPSKSILLKAMTIYLLKDLPAHNRGKYGLLSCIVEKIGSEAALEWDSSLPTELLKALEEYSLVSHVSELCQVLFICSQDKADDKKFQNIWLKPLLGVLCKGSKEQISAVTEHILPKLLHVKPSSLKFLLSELCNMWEKNIGNSFSALITCMKLYQKQKGALSYLEFMSNDSLIKAFFHANDQIRLSAFALLCENFKTTEPIDSNTLELLKFGLPYNINCQSPPFRQQLTSYMKKLFTRMIESAYALIKKQQSNEEEKSNFDKVMLPNNYLEFLQWLKNYLFSCFFPGANFPRRVISLNLLYTMHEIFLHSMPIVDSEAAAQTLLYALQDTYDNNKFLALKLLTSEYSLRLTKEGETVFNSAITLACSTKPPDTATAAYLFAYMVQCPNSFQVILMKLLFLLASQDSTLSLTVPDTSESSYDFHLSTIALLMYELNKQLQLAKKSLLEAAACAPLYGILACIRSVLNDVKVFNEKSCIVWQLLIKDLISLSLNVAFVVEPIVCNSSPEGHLPMDTSHESIAQLQAAVRRALGSRFQSAVVLEHPSTGAESIVLDIVKTHAVTAQILLLCCWRTHKEVSLLFGDISEKLPLFQLDNVSRGVLCADQMEDIGKYFLHQMSLVKHKGAFEQAHIGFSKLCNRLWRSDVDELHELPKIWLEDMMLAIKGFKEDIQLCPTRRSAGLPFIIQAIVASEPCFSNSTFFRRSISTFLELTQPSQIYNSDVQVHSMNVLRTLFRDACLGEAVMPYVSEGLKISIKGFKSCFWAVRNSSTLLFSALMTRVFGVNRSHDEKGKKNRLTGKFFYSYYKDLYIFLIDEIKQCVDALIKDKTVKISIQPSLYPILLFLGRLYPAPGEEDTILSPFIPYLQICTSNSIWKTRTLAAKALVAFTPHEKKLLSLENDIKDLGTSVPLSQNEIHGKMLQILYFMEEVGCMSDLEKIALRNTFQLSFKKCFQFYIRNNRCASTKAAFLQIYLYSMTLDVEPDISIMTEWLLEEVKYPCTDPDIDNYLVVCVAILFLKELELHNSNICSDNDTVLSPTNIMTHSIHAHRPVIMHVFIEILLWVLQKDSEECKDYSDSSDDDVVVERVLKTVISLDRKKYNVSYLVEGEYVKYLVQLLGCVTDPSLLRQLYKLLSFIPSSLTIQWKFLKTSHSCDLIDKLQHILNLLEIYTRDDITSELLVYSTHLFAKLYEESQLDKGMLVLKPTDLDVVKEWCEKVEECSSPKNSILLRKTIVYVLGILVARGVFPKSSLPGHTGSLKLWQALLFVLIDDEPEIKCRASEIIIKMKLTQNQGISILSAVPSKAVDVMVEMFVENNYDDPINCISMLINWMLSSDSFSFESMMDEQPFDKGELNIFSEDLNLTKIVSNHLLALIASEKLSKVNLISTSIILCWNDKVNTTLTFQETILLCLSEANSAISSYLMRAAISPMLDAYFDQELIYISQRLAVILALLPFSESLSDFNSLGNKLLQQFLNLDFRTFLIEDVISKIQYFLHLL